VAALQNGFREEGVKELYSKDLKLCHHAREVLVCSETATEQPFLCSIGMLGSRQTMAGKGDAASCAVDTGDHSS
jgi:hypothetical protein